MKPSPPVWTKVSTRIDRRQIGRRRILHMLTLVAALLASSCVTTPGTPVRDDGPVTTEMLLDRNPMVSGMDIPDLSQVDPLALTPEMVAFVDSYVNRSHGQTARLRRLLYAIMGEGTFDLVYDDVTRTASQTFQDQQGNCLSFTNMFVAMARNVGLDARFQEVLIPPDWSIEGQSFIFSQHINVHVDLGSGYLGGDQIIDFNMYDFRDTYEREVVSDNRARAHYFNNIGVEKMLAGDTAVAFANFRQSIREDDTFTPAWANLGILHRREGYENLAEFAYLKALDIDPVNLVAMSNLASLYEQQEKTELAEQYRSRVKSHRMHNPYFRYLMARTLFEEGDYDGSIGHLEYAIRRKDDDDQFYSLMSLDYLMKGDREAAQKWMKKAESIAEKESDKQRYHNKFEMMVRDGADPDSL
jgi:tetratricopeptide (TPR) repeat protein